MCPGGGGGHGGLHAFHITNLTGKPDSRPRGVREDLTARSAFQTLRARGACSASRARNARVWIASARREDEGLSASRR
jgi:hypothetical protein